MRIPAILLALVAIVGYGSTAPKPAQPSAEEVWNLTLPESIRAGLNNSELVTRVMIGAQEIPLGGFEPDPAGTLGNVYDESITAGNAAPDRK